MKIQVVGVAPEFMPDFMRRQGITAQTPRRTTPRPASAPTVRPASEIERERVRQQEQEASAEQRAHTEGQRIGKQHDGDPWKLAKAINAGVEYGDTGKMLDRGCDAWCLKNPANPDGPHLIVIANNLTPAEERHRIAHECGHLLGFDVYKDFKGERNADIFAEQFLKQEPETPMEKAVRIRRESEQRAQREARLRSLARR